MDVRKITINIAGRVYPLNVPANEEETLRKVGKQIENMIKDFEQNFDIRDKQDALAMCALRLGTSAEVFALNNEKNINASNERLIKINQFLEALEK
ncbi:cell division protein ZapA [Chryseobacterium sp. MFBS3-17]|uniref:cell division protein ZapA n=1 Tax=Chryseobacterium sp. MFBS3-17 TaxID=2886689 RepID=UPI001D0DDE8B|nr:cell division protein ZapA [Chryseobacterium sp. MFBS3-17]MCC2589899.1 cell division protein ZapA [Chryseobacterium sp. MFBS3-17]